MSEPDTPAPVPDVMLPGGAVMRLVRPDDAPALLAAYRRNAAHLAPTEPRRGERFATLEGQRERIEGQLREWEAGRAVPWVLDGSGVPGAPPALGTLTFTGIVRGPLLSASVGYWVDQGHTGRGLAGQALAHAVAYARDALGLHRLEAGTLLDNTASQRVLLRAGFTWYGTAPDYLHIAGAWRDHHRYQLILGEVEPRL
ncbi:GNAT family N-acetyltransferase [Streptomyces albidoflavus]|uniref:GNAT family N-acetyltransferase n=1 Tax=Streptomyces albidoflavus TaxID=1886 RepID=UPI0033CCC593